MPDTWSSAEVLTDKIWKKGEIEFKLTSVIIPTKLKHMDTNRANLV